MTDLPYGIFFLPLGASHFHLMGGLSLIGVRALATNTHLDGLHRLTPSYGVLCLMLWAAAGRRDSTS